MILNICAISFYFMPDAIILHSDEFRDFKEKLQDVYYSLNQINENLPITLFIIIFSIFLLAMIFFPWFVWLQLKLKSQNKKLNKAIDQLNEEQSANISNQKFLDRIFNLSPFAAFITDEKGTLIRANESLKEQLNLTDEQLIGNYNLISDPILERQGFSELVKSVFKDGRTVHFTCIWDGNEYHVADLTGSNSVIADITIFPIFDSTNVLTNTVTTWVDVKNRVMMLKELQNSEKRYQELFDKAPLAYQSIDNRGRFLDVNQTWLDTFGYKKDEVIGNSFKKFIASDEESASIFNNIISCSELKVDELRILHKSGKWIDTSLSSKLSFDDDGFFRKYHCILIDITETKKISEQLRQSEKMQAIGQLAGGIAHDFNNQLSVISGYTELLLPKLKNHKNEEYLKNIALATEHAADLTSKLLAFSRKGKYLSIPVNIHDTINEITAILEHSIDKKITIVRNLNSETPVCTGDPSQIQNVLLNLALNARDAMPDGGTLTFTTFDTNIDDDYVEVANSSLAPGEYTQIQIKDTGHGISSDIQDRIFEPFFTTKPNGKGTGMGLASAYGTIKNHGGAVSVFSEPDFGTTFTLFLPTSRHTSAIPVTMPTDNELPAKLNILVVDDEAMLRKICTEMLVDLNCTVTTCTDGEEALEYYKNNYDKIDLVILDMIMPVISGYETFVQMKKINPKVKAIISSGYSLNGEAQKLIDCGVISFIGKPFKSKELAIEIKKVFSV